MELLDFLMQQANCEYISDLKLQKGEACRILQRMPETDYSLKEWNEAVRYIYGTHRDFHTLQEIREYLDEWRQRK